MVLLGTYADDLPIESDFKVSALTWSIFIDGLGLETIMVCPWTSVAAFETATSQYMNLYGKLIPSIPAWMSGEAPRSKGTLPDGMKFGWAENPTHWIRFIAALAGWMHSVAQVDDVEARDRGVRRRMKKEKMPPSKVTFVKLREIEHHETGPMDASGREYSHRWVVSGHWRNQPCGPKRSRRRPVYVAPYIKGPADKPLVYKERIWSVDR
jgi:hypothetical protein